MTALSPLQLRILSPEGVILKVNDVTSVNVPLVDGGSIGIRPGHAALIAETVQGRVRYAKTNVENHIEIMPGILDISDNVVTILTSHKFSDDQEKLENDQNHEFSRLIQAISEELALGVNPPADKVTQ